MGYIPDRGDIIWLEFDPQAGHEQRGHRPGLVLTGKEYNKKSNLILVCPITSKIKGYPFEVMVTGKVEGAILSDQVKSFDWKSRHAKFIQKVSDAILDQVKENVMLLINE